jgi:hypothetical protein
MYHFIHFMQTIQKLSIGGILLCEDDIRIITYDHCVGVIRVAPTYVNDSHRGMADLDSAKVPRNVSGMLRATAEQPISQDEPPPSPFKQRRRVR